MAQDGTNGTDLRPQLVSLQKNKKGTINKLQGFLLSRWEAHVKKFVVSLLRLLNDTHWQWDLVACWVSGVGALYELAFEGRKQACLREGHIASTHFEEMLLMQLKYSIQIIAIFQNPHREDHGIHFAEKQIEVLRSPYSLMI